MSDISKLAIIGSDHGAVDLKTQVSAHLEECGYTVKDLGTQGNDPVDYPEISREVCEAFLKGDYEFGIVLCGTGIGVSIAANKVPGIRCALVHDPFTAEMAKAHNDANILALGGRVTYEYSIESILNAYLSADFLGEERHSRRVDALMSMDKKR
jgi:ribose 5-phosphate isomerase B